MDLGPPELLIILGLVILVFGVGRIGQLGGELGRAIREFRRGLQNDPDPGNPPASAPPNSDTEPASK